MDESSRRLAKAEMPESRLRSVAPELVHPYRWVMLVLVWCCYISFGTLSSSTAPLVTAIMDDLKLGATQMGFVLGTWQLVYIAVAFWCGAIMDRLGVRRSVAAGMLFLAVSAVLRGFATDFISLALAVALSGIGGPMISVGSPKIVSLWFRGRQRGVAIGVSNTGPALGGVLILATANSILIPLTGSWRGATLVPGVVIIFFAVLWCLFAHDAPQSDVDTQLRGARVNPVQTMRGLLKVRNVQVLLSGAAATFAVGHAMTNWLPKILESKSLTPSDAGLFASLSTAAGIISTLLVPRFVVPGKRRLMLTTVFVGQSLTILSLGIATGTGVLFTLPFVGLFQQAIYPLVLLLLMDTPEVGSQHMGTIGGLYFALAEIGGFSGPFILGFLLDFTGTFSWGIALLVCLAVFLSILSRFLQEKPNLVFQPRVET